MNGLNTQFSNDPLGFLALYGVDPRGAGGNQGSNPSPWTWKTQDTVYLDMVPYHAGGKWFKSYNKVKACVTNNLVACTRDVAVSGYYFPYVMYQLVASKAADHKDLEYLKIPKNGSGHKFAFTGGLCGCNILVLEHSSQFYEVVHYPNSTGRKLGYPLLGDKKDSIVAELHYELYAGDSDQGNAFVFLHHNGTRWRIIYQPLRIDVVDRTWVYRPHANLAARAINVE